MGGRGVGRRAPGARLTAVVAAELAEFEPPVLLAVTTARMVRPTSPLARV